MLDRSAMGRSFYIGVAMTIEELIKKIRFRANDTNEALYSDYDILDKINEANRFFRKICYQEAPDLLAVKREGTLDCDEGHIHLCAMPIQVTDVFVGCRHLEPANERTARHYAATGTPRVYVISGRCAVPFIEVFPKPTDATEYSATYIPETVELGKNDEIIIPADCASYIVDYAVTRLTQGDPQAFSELDSNLRSILRNYTPSPCVVDSYY